MLFEPCLRYANSDGIGLDALPGASIGGGAAAAAPFAAISALSSAGTSVAITVRVPSSSQCTPSGTWPSQICEPAWSGTGSWPRCAPSTQVPFAEPRSRT